LHTFHLSPLTQGVLERALTGLLPWLPYWALRHAGEQVGWARSPRGCALRACVLAYLEGEYDCSNLLGSYAEEIWIQGTTRPLRVPFAPWATTLIRGLDAGKQMGATITGAEVLAQLQRQGLLVMSYGKLWAQGALALALLKNG
jgi:hypothetical protein